MSHAMNNELKQDGAANGVGSGEMVRRLWLLRPLDGLPKENNPWEPWYDKTFGFVVCADSEEEARQLANADGGHEVGPVSHTVYRTGGDAWLDAKLSSCVELTANREKGVIIYDHASA